MTDMAFAIALSDARPALVKYALRLCRDHERSEDLASDTIAKAWRYRAKFEVGTNLIAWLSTILRNAFLSEQRRKRWDGGYIEDRAAFDVPGPASQEDYIHLRDLEEALSLINPEQKDAIMAIVLEGDYEHAAKALGVEVGTIKSRVGRGRRTLHEISS